MTSIIGTPQLVDAGAYNAAYTPETGAEGVVILFAHEQGGTGRYMQSLGLGGQAMTNILQREQVLSGGSTRICIEAWVLNAAGIAAMSGNAITFTAHGSGNGSWKGAAYSLDQWDQVTPLSQFVTDGQFTATDLLLSLTPPSDSIVLGIWACSDESFGINSTKGLDDSGFTLSRLSTNTGTGYAIYTTFRNEIGHRTGSGSALNVTLDSNTASTTSAQVGALLVFPTVASNNMAGSGAAVAQGSAALTTPAITFTLRDTDTGLLKNAVTYANVHVVNAASRGTISASLTSRITNASGVMTLRAPGIATIGATYDVAGWSSDGSDRFHASAICADL